MGCGNAAARCLLSRLARMIGGYVCLQEALRKIEVLSSVKMGIYIVHAWRRLVAVIHDLDL